MQAPELAYQRACVLTDDQAELTGIEIEQQHPEHKLGGDGHVWLTVKLANATVEGLSPPTTSQNLLDTAPY